jgi:hypothetical protein
MSKLTAVWGDWSPGVCIHSVVEALSCGPRSFADRLDGSVSRGRTPQLSSHLYDATSVAIVPSLPAMSGKAATTVFNADS